MLDRTVGDIFHVGPADTFATVARKAVRFHRYQALTALWSVSSLKGVRECTRREAISDVDGKLTVAPVVELGTADGVGSVVGVRRCCNVHACHVCAPKVRNGRAQEIRQIVHRHKLLGGEALFLTLTMPHRNGMALKPLWETVAGSWTKMLAGGTRQAWRDSYGLSGYVRALEPTHGANGWHPHLHCLLLVDRPLQPHELARLRADILASWQHLITQAGWGLPSEANGIKLDRVRSTGDLAGYLTKLDGTRIDAELARGDMKDGKRRGGRSPWAIFRDFVETGDADDLSLWHEYERASYRKNAITFSRGLRERYGVTKRTEADLAQESVGHVTLATLAPRSWRKVCEHGEATAILQAVEAGNRELAWLILDVCGAWVRDLRWLDPP